MLRWSKLSSSPVSIRDASDRDLNLRSEILDLKFKRPHRYKRDGADLFAPECRLDFFFRIDPDLHPLQHLHILVG